MSRTSSKRRRQLIGILIAVIVAISVFVALSYILGHNSHSQVSTNERATFSEYGFEIQYPVGSEMNTKGVLSEQPNSQSGTVYWAWNGQTALIVLWINSSSYNYTAGFSGIQSNLEKNSTSVNVTAGGNTTLNGLSWVYETFQYATNGTTAYVTYAFKFFQNEGRIYELAFEDSSPDTLISLENWGSSFQG